MASADYVIVGAGSAGCVLANRLTEDPAVRVVLVEAGGKDRHPNIKIPAAFANQFHTKLDWDFATEPEPHCDGRSLTGFNGSLQHLDRGGVDGKASGMDGGVDGQVGDEVSGAAVVAQRGAAGVLA